MDKKKTATERIILGIDPGTNVTGYGIIKTEGKNKATVITLGIIQLDKYDDHYKRLKRIFDRVLAIINTYHPDELAIEAPFYGKNVQSMLKLGRAQGAAISAALHRDIPIFEYAPRKIKVAITGTGTASKEQVAIMLQKLLNLPALPDKEDATDALGAALCHFYQDGRNNEKSGYSSWKDFIAKNPNRAK